MTKEKVSLLLNKMSLGYVLSLFVALINIVVVFIFKNTAIRPTYYCRWLSLVSIILCLVFALAELGLNIYRFVKNKGAFLPRLCYNQYHAIWDQRRFSRAGTAVGTVAGPEAGRGPIGKEYDRI